ncbi:MAG: DUF5615 family PIN-like protein [Tepidisphaeraceae bacterium]|jgi:hypothetical protein
MLRLLADENFNGDIVRGLSLRQPDIDLVRVQDVGLAGAEDSAILSWCVANNRILLTHDRATMPVHAYRRMDSGEKMAGVFVIHNRFPVGKAIDEILLLIACSKQVEWNGRVVYLPL